jgi:hypothetical protein
MIRKSIVMPLVVVATMSAAAAGAEEQELNFTLVTTPVVETSTPVLTGEQAITAASSVGTAHFEDGRTAFKEYVVIMMGAGEGEMRGYSSYVFADGDALLLRFSGGWGADGLGGDYEVVSATGAFEGATGTGRFDAVEADWERSVLFEGTLTLEVPDS